MKNGTLFILGSRGAADELFMCLALARARGAQDRRFMRMWKNKARVLNLIDGGGVGVVLCHKIFPNHLFNILTIHAI